MTKRTKPPKMNSEQILEAWIASQDDSSEMKRAAMDSFEAGQSSAIDIHETFNGETIVTHCERFYLASDRFIVVCYDDGGNVTFGGM
jgi:hypothetical protein